MNEVLTNIVMAEITWGIKQSPKDQMRGFKRENMKSIGRPQELLQHPSEMWTPGKRRPSGVERIPPKMDKIKNAP